MNELNALMGLFINDRNIIDLELKDANFDKELTLKFSFRNRGSIRLSQGLFYTNQEWQQRRAELIKKPLP